MKQHSAQKMKTQLGAKINDILHKILSCCEKDHRRPLQIGHPTDFRKLTPGSINAVLLKPNCFRDDSSTREKDSVVSTPARNSFDFSKPDYTDAVVIHHIGVPESPQKIV